MGMTDLERVLQGLDCVSGFGHCLQSEAFAGGICVYCMKEIAKKAKELLKEQEMNKLVRCKDCKNYRYYGLSEETVSECIIGHEENPDGNWFCADGKRREDDA